ncbi:MAG: hypothetical protein OEY14_13390, partial [Myxococcales bacterium]|nr:hypothetical protein [Myxococcales bacterium]
RIPAHPATQWSRLRVGGGPVEGASSESFRLPSELMGRQVELQISLSKTVLATMEGGLESLMNYPNGCVEQTTSRLIPMVNLEDVFGGADGERLADSQHRARMQESVAHVLRHQNPDGGFGLWPESASEGFLTAYALWGLMTARDHGYRVPDERLEAGKAYLEAHATEGGDMHGQFSSADTPAFAAYVLAQARVEDHGLGARLAGSSELSSFGSGLVANALIRRASGADGERGVEALFARLDAARERGGPGRALVRDRGPAGFMAYGSHLRASAVAVQALVAAGRVGETAELIEGILAERRGDGSWGTTYNNMWALQALSAVATATERDDEPAPVRLSIGGQVVARVQLGSGERARRIVIPESALPRAGQRVELRVEAPAGSEVRYQAMLRYVLRPDVQRSESNGLRVARELRDASSGALVERPRVGQLLRVRLTLGSDVARQQIALTDRLPAGLEAVDSSLESRARAATLSHDGIWTWQELHDERVAFFADSIGPGVYHAEYLARASRSGEFVHPAPAAEAMYDPEIHARGEIGRLLVDRP